MINGLLNESFEVALAEAGVHWNDPLDKRVSEACSSWAAPDRSFFSFAKGYFPGIRGSAVFADYRAVQTSTDVDSLCVAGWAKVVESLNTPRLTKFGKEKSVIEAFVKWFQVKFQDVCWDYDGDRWRFSSVDVADALLRFLANQFQGVIWERQVFERLESSVSPGWSVVWGSSFDDVADVDLWICCGEERYPVSVKCGSAFDVGLLRVKREDHGKTKPHFYVNERLEWLSKDLFRFDECGLRWFK